MEAYRRSFRNEYVDGSTVRKLHEIPYGDVTLPERRIPLTEEEFKEAKRRRKAALSNKSNTRATNQVSSIDLISLLVLCAAISVTLYVCVSFLMVQSRITSISKETANLQSELVELKNDNNTSLERINTSVDLTYIYKVATKELGMVHAMKDQIITYENTKSDYARKYADIPEVQNSNILDRFWEIK